MNPFRINSIVALGAFAALLCFDLPADVATRPPAKLNGTLRSGRHVEDFAISGDSTWVVYRADEETSGILELYSRPIAGSSWPIKMNEPLVSGSKVSAYAISPDGARVVYIAAQTSEPAFQLYSRPLDGLLTASTMNGPLVSGGGVIDFAISPDSRWLIYRAVQERAGVFEIYSRDLSGIAKLDDPKKLNGTLSGQVVVSYLIFSDSAWMKRPMLTGRG